TKFAFHFKIKPMNENGYRKALQTARTEYEVLIQQRVRLEERILQLKQTIAGLVALSGAKEVKIPLSKKATAPFPNSISLTSATRQILAGADSAIHPPELRNALARRGINVSQYTNALAVIHNTLRRLARQGEAIQIGGAWSLTHKGRLAAKMDL